MVLTVATMLHTEPMRGPTRLGKTESRFAAAAAVFARMIVDAPSIARDRCHAFGKAGWFIAHIEKIPQTGLTRKEFVPFLFSWRTIRSTRW
ncbi:hypothetical protein, partial [Mesorhizobium sp.]|uniref:hypothetical protein n=1 Tax=Mesorhizobium sp. TaxID=1871066 RepID=UPI0025FD6258